jgi:hypothetical protein
VNAGDDIHHQVTAMLAYFDRHGTPTEASFTCAAILAGVVTTLLPPDAAVSYAQHLVRFDHDVALEKALHGVPAVEEAAMSDGSGIFVSYRHRTSDTGFMAGRLYERLSAAFGADQVFADVAMAAPGVDLAGATEDAVTRSAAMLVLIGPGWDPDGAARSEIATGLTRGLRVIPVLVGTADLPEEQALPADLASLARRQPRPLRPERFGTDVARLIDALHGLVPARDATSVAPGAATDDEFGMAVSAYVAADIDLDVLVDGVETLRVDHSGGFDYAAATIVVRPTSVITFRAPGLRIERRASQIVDGAERKLEVRVGTDTRANIPITEEQRRAAMGTPDDVPGLIDVLAHGDRSARAWAATRLGAIGDRRAVAPLIAIVDTARPDQDLDREWLQSQAALALAELGEPVARQAIQRALDNLPNRDHYAYLFEAALRDFPSAP